METEVRRFIVTDKFLERLVVLSVARFSSKFKGICPDEMLEALKAIESILDKETIKTALELLGNDPMTITYKVLAELKDEHFHEADSL